MKKLALTKMIKLVQEGKLSHEAAGKAARALNLKPRTLRMLGLKPGGEGVAHLQTSPYTKDGLQVMKTYNTHGPYYGPQLIEDKARVWDRLVDVGMAPKYLGRHKGGRPVTYHEYVPQKKPHYTGEQLREIEYQYGITDLKGSNVHDDKIIDFLPHPPNEKYLTKVTRHQGLAMRAAKNANDKLKAGKITPERHQELVGKARGFYKRLQHWKETGREMAQDDSINRIMAHAHGGKRQKAPWLKIGPA